MDYRDPRELARAIATHAGSLGVVAIDGTTGAGKTTLAKALAAQLGGIALDLDDFLDPNRGAFLEALRIAELRAAILKAPSPPTIVSGVCMLAALERVGTPPDVFVYVKRMANWGWADEDEVLGDALNNWSAMFEISELAAEIRDYHGAWRPHEVATHIFERDD